MSDFKKFRINTNLGIHYLTKNEVLDSDESIDVSFATARSDPSLVGDLTGCEVKGVMSADLADPNNVLALRLASIPSSGDVTQEHVIKYLELLKWLGLEQFNLTSFQNLMSYAISAWANHSSGVIANEIQDMRSYLFRILNQQEDSVGVLRSMVDTLDQDDNIDWQLTDAKWDEEFGLVLPGDSPRTIVLPSQVTPSFEGATIGHIENVTTGQATKTANNDEINLFSSYQVHTTDPAETVIYKVLVDPSIGIADTKLLVIKLVTLNGIEAIELRYKTKSGDWVDRQVFVESERTLTFTLDNTLDDLEQLHLSFISTAPDITNEQGFIHVFAIEDIVLFKTETATEDKVMVTKPLEMKNLEGEVQKFRSLFVDFNAGQGFNKETENLVLEVQTRNSNTGLWNSWVKVNKGKGVNVTSGVTFTNTGTRGEQLLIPFKLGASSDFAMIDYTLSGVSVPDFIDKSGSAANSLNPNELVVIRGAGSKVLYTHPTIASLSEGDLTGYIQEGNDYTTYVVVPPGQSYEIDFGTNPIIINGSKVIGKFKFESGVYKVTILAEYWSPIAQGLSRTALIKRDNFFPYNHKYLIQGYKDIVEYEGLQTYGRHVCSYVDPDYIMSGSYNVADTDIHPNIFSTVNISGILYFIFPTGTNYTDYAIEKIAVWGQYYDTSTFADAYRLRFTFLSNAQSFRHNPVYLDSFTVRALQ